MDVALSVKGAPIRLTPERWFHIVENHDDLAGYYDDVLRTVEEPDLVLSGSRGSLVAARGYGRDRYLCVIYREVTEADGFAITAYFTSRIDRKKALWRRQ